jgi:hypothetical protein
VVGVGLGVGVGGFVPRLVEEGLVHKAGERSEASAKKMLGGKWGGAPHLLNFLELPNMPCCFRSTFFVSNRLR